MHLCYHACLYYPAITDNKHELIQVVIAANVTTHKTPVSEASTLQTERLHTTARDFVS